MEQMEKVGGQAKLREKPSVNGISLLRYLQ